MEGKPEGYIFDWLTYFKSSRNLILFGSLSLMNLVWEAVQFCWGFLVGWVQKDQECKDLREILYDLNPILHISIIYMTDSSLINSIFELAIWVFIYYFFTVLRVFTSAGLKQIKVQISNIVLDYVHEERKIKQVGDFCV